jgi:hypothetical protein
MDSVRSELDRLVEARAAFSLGPIPSGFFQSGLSYKGKLSMWHVLLVDRLGGVVRKLATQPRYEAALAFAAGYGTSYEGVAVVSRDETPGDALEFYAVSRDDSDEVSPFTLTDIEERERAAKVASGDETVRVTHCRLTLAELIAALGGSKAAGLALLDSHGIEDLERRWGSPVDTRTFYIETLYGKLDSDDRDSINNFAETLYAEKLGKTLENPQETREKQSFGTC